MVTREQVLHVARLARLELSPEDEERFVAQLGEVLEYVEQLGALDGAAGAAGAAEESAAELTHVAVVEGDPRPDEPRPGLPREEVMRLAPKTDGETMQVPAVLDGESHA